MSGEFLDTPFFRRMMMNLGTRLFSCVRLEGATSAPIMEFLKAARIWRAPCCRAIDGIRR